MMASKREKDSGKAWTDKHIWENGESANLKGTECLWLKMAIDTRASIKMPLSMGKVFKSLWTEIFTRGFSRTGHPVVTGNITGKTRATSRVTFPTAFAPVKVSGNVPLVSLTSTKVSIKMTKNGGMVSSLGLMATFLRETTKATLETDTAKCSGLMEATIKVNGKTGFRTVKVFFF